MGTLVIRLFGTMEVERDSRPLPPFPSRKTKELFAYLLLNRQRPQSREHLATLFWGESDEGKTRHSLNTTLWRLRTVLGPADAGDQPHLRIGAQSIGINGASSFQLDTAEFERCCHLATQVGPDAPEAQANLWRQALSFYRGDLLTECYEDWCLVERERLHELSLKALGRLLAYHSMRREYEDAIGYAQRILVCDPLREKVHRALIQLYLASGQRAAALHHYSLCEDTMRTNMGTALMPETRALLPRLLGGGPAAAPTAGPGSAARMPATVEQAHDFPAALERLRTALAALDQAREQVAEAAACFEETQRRSGVSVHVMGDAASLALFGPPSAATRAGAETVRHASGLVAPSLRS